MAVQVSDTRDYALSTGHVELRVDIGDAQVGRTTIELGGQSTDLTPGQWTDLGPPEALQDRPLHTITSVVAVNPATKHTSVTYRLRGGVEDAEYPYAVDVAQTGDTARYLIDFLFF